MGSSRLGVSNKGGVGKMSYFLALHIDISKNGTRLCPKSLSMTNRKLHVLLKGTKIDDPG